MFEALAAGLVIVGVFAIGILFILIAVHSVTREK